MRIMTTTLKTELASVSIEGVWFVNLICFPIDDLVEGGTARKETEQSRVSNAC